MRLSLSSWLFETAWLCVPAGRSCCQGASVSSSAKEFQLSELFLLEEKKTEATGEPSEGVRGLSGRERRREAEGGWGIR